MDYKIEITSRITAKLEPEYLEIIDESSQHQGHSGYKDGGQTHFKIIIRSNKLNNLNRVQAHRVINDLLADLLKTQIHALSIKLLS